MDIFGIQAPDDFPSEAYHKVEHLFTAWPGVDRGLAKDQLRASWNAVGFRFLAAALWDDDWRASLAAFGINPHPDERLRQETVLFGFYVAAAAVMESFCYAVFAAAALAQPRHFREVLRWNRQWLVNYSDTSARLLVRFPGEPLTASLEAALAAPEYKQITGIRNVLLHRSLPLRHHSLDAHGQSVGPSEWHLGIRGLEAVAITPDLTVLPRLWLSHTLALLFDDMATFVLARKTTDGEAVSTTTGEGGSIR